MPRHTGDCTICASSHRIELDFLIGLDANLAALARRYNLSIDALRRHAANHVSQSFRRALRRAPFRDEERLRSLLARSSATAIEKLEAIIALTSDRWMTAIQAGDDKRHIELGRRLEELVAMQVKLTQALTPPPSLPNVIADLKAELLGAFGQTNSKLSRKDVERVFDRFPRPTAEEVIERDSLHG